MIDSKPRSSSFTWPPPPALELYAGTIANECEEAEMNPGSLAASRPMSVPIHMAALLYLGEHVHVQHLRRRIQNTTTTAGNDDALTEAWWNVCVAIRDGNDSAVAAMLQEYTQTHPEPLNHYASQVQMAYQATQGQVKSSIGSATRRELDTTKIVSFLEATKWTAQR